MTQSSNEVREFLAEAIVPPGWRYTLVLASEAKRALASDIPDGFRLYLLEHLEKLLHPTADGTASYIYITQDMFAALEPMDDRGVALLREAMKAGGTKGLDVIAKVFPEFAILNPSLIEAVRLSPLYQWKMSGASARPIEA